MANNLGVDPFPDPVGHFGGPWRPFWILQAVRRCRWWVSAPGAARLVFSIRFKVIKKYLLILFSFVHNMFFSIFQLEVADKKIMFPNLFNCEGVWIPPQCWMSSQGIIIVTLPQCFVVPDKASIIISLIRYGLGRGDIKVWSDLC